MLRGFTQVKSALRRFTQVKTCATQVYAGKKPALRRLRSYAGFLNRITQVTQYAGTFCLYALSTNPKLYNSTVGVNNFWPGGVHRKITPDYRVFLSIGRNLLFSKPSILDAMGKI